MDGLARLSVLDGEATLTLNHGQKRNALGSDMLASIGDHLEALMHDVNVRVLVIQSQEGGGNVFSSGHNLVELHAMSRGQQEDMLRDSVIATVFVSRLFLVAS